MSVNVLHPVPINAFDINYEYYCVLKIIFKELNIEYDRILGYKAV
jgi:hypothetical protein